MMLVFATLVTLCFWLVAGRALRAHGRPFAPIPRARGTGSLGWLIGAALVVAAHQPMLAAARVLFDKRALLPGDSATHAAVSLAIARDGLPHGWIATYNGGLPFGIHYPWTSWLGPAALIRAGVTPANAFHGVGIAAILLLPLCVLWAARALGATAAAGTAAALAIAWVAPWTEYAGGWDAQLARGLLTQTLALPLVPLFAAALFAPVRGHWAPIVGAALVAAHPQIAVNAFAVALPAVVVGRGAAWSSARPFERLARAAIAGAIVGLAMYGFGLATLHVPLGWRPSNRSQQLGYGLSVVEAWFANGELLDSGRAPVLTIAWLVALVTLVLAIRWRAARVLVVATAAALAIALGGRELDAWTGGVGRFLAAFLQPLRVLPLIPLLAAASIGAAVDRAVALTHAIAEGRGSARVLLAGVGALLFAIGWSIAVPSRSRWIADNLLVAERWGGRPCGDATPNGFDLDAMSAWIGALDRGRFAFDDGPPTLHCPRLRGLELAARVPLAGSHGAGAHVYVNAAALYAVRPREPGSAARAEMLGVRTLLHTRADAPKDGDWKPRAALGEMVLSERAGGTDTIGVGCITEAWRGDDAALYRALVDDLEGRASTLAHPTELVRLDSGFGPVERVAVPADACNTAGAVVAEKPREPGAYEATVTAPHDVDVVVRATAFPTWTVRVDGTPVPFARVAPGWMAVRVSAGTHAIDATASWPRYYALGLVAAVVLVAGLAYARFRA